MKSKTRITVEHSDKGGLWLATLDMGLGDGQSLSFTYLTPIDERQTVAQMEHHLMREAHRLLGEMLLTK